MLINIFSRYNIRIVFMSLFLLISFQAATQDDCKIEIGTNLSGIADFSTEIPFVNLMKMSREWYTKGENDPNFEWDTGYADLLSYDNNGYPTHIPQNVAGTSLAQQVATVWDGMDGWPSGKYTLLWDGIGDFEFWGDFDNLVKVNNNTYEFDYQETEDGILQITMISSQINDPVTNMRLLLPGTLNTYQNNPFYQVWLDLLSPFKTVRFMDWGHTNFWGQEDPYTWDIPELVDWNERTPLDYYTYTGNKGVPYELMIQLMNQTDVDGWVCIPHRASNEYITQMAEFFRDNCENDRQIYVEYSNEIWNWIFGQTQWLNLYGCENQNISWPEGTVPYVQNALDIWSNSFSSQLDRITRVAAVHTGWLDVTERMLYNLNPNSFDVVSPTFYFSFNDASEAILDGYGSNATVEDIATEVRLSMTEDLDLISQIKSVADGLNKPIAFYEGGQHMTPTPFGDVPSYESALLDIQRDQVMYDIYSEWLDSIKTLNTAVDPMLLMHFSFIAPRSSRYGSWGMLENIQQDLASIPAPKYQAILENIGCDSSTFSPNIQLEDNAICVLPNPNEGIFTIKGEISKYSIRILDSIGNVYQDISSSTNDDININISNLPNGIYLVLILSMVNNDVEVQKILKF